MLNVSLIDSWALYPHCQFHSLIHTYLSDTLYLWVKVVLYWIGCLCIPLGPLSLDLNWVLNRLDMFVVHRASFSVLYGTCIFQVHRLLCTVLCTQDWHSGTEYCNHSQCAELAILSRQLSISLHNDLVTLWWYLFKSCHPQTLVAVPDGPWGSSNYTVSSQLCIS